MERSIRVLMYTSWEAMVTNSLATSRSISCRRASHAMYWSQIREMEMSWISILFLPQQI